MCKADALLDKTKVKWHKRKGSGYQYAYKKGWLNLCCEHMIGGNIKWTLKLCKTRALLYKTRTKWKKNDGSGYQAANRHGWFDICCKHMVKERKKKK